MLPIVKKAVIILILGTMTFFVVNTASHSQENQENQFQTNPLIEDLKLDSSRYSHKDDMRDIESEDYLTLTDDDVEYLDNTNFTLYVNEETLGMKVLNKATNYIWSTTIDDPQAGNFNPLLSSGIGFEYIDLEIKYALKQNIGLIETEFTYTLTENNDTLSYDIAIGGFCTTSRCERNFDDYSAGNISIEEMIDFGFIQLDVGFTFEVTLTEDGLEAFIPYDSIYEKNPDRIQLSSLIIFPGLGASHLDDLPGYMMIPDGAGALIRYEDKKGVFPSPYRARFYGEDYGVNLRRQDLNTYRLSMPIFGAVHGIKQHGFIGIIESGDMNARLYAYPNGASNQPYNLIFPKYDLKQTYRQSFTSDKASGATRIYQGNINDIKVRYDFVSDYDADYIGLARRYQRYLVDNDMLTLLTDTQTNIPIHIQYLMADSKNRFIGKDIVEMTTVDDVQRMYDYFMQEGLTNQRVSLLGWNDGGYSGNLPSDINFENKLGSNRAFNRLIEHITSENTLMLVNNYVIGSNGTSGVSYRNDVAQGVDRFKLEYKCENCVYKDTYLFYPEFTKDRALDDLEDYKDYNVEVLFESMGSLIYSYYDRGYYTREDALGYYKPAIEAYQGIANYNSPNAYALGNMNGYYNAPLYNNQYNFFDDLVPIIPIVLSGHMEMYSQFLNYNSLGKEQVLMLIDFGINPSFILTEERPSLLTGTDIERYYTSEFDAWEQSVIDTYQYMNNALKHTQGAHINERTVIDTGIVLVTYSNGIEIVINYTNANYIYDNELIVPLSYYVSGDNNA